MKYGSSLHRRIAQLERVQQPSTQRASSMARTALWAGNLTISTPRDSLTASDSCEHQSREGGNLPFVRQRQRDNRRNAKSDCLETALHRDFALLAIVLLVLLSAAAGAVGASLSLRWFGLD